MTREEAVQAALADGMREDQINDKVLIVYGYSPVNPVEKVDDSVVLTDEQVKESLILLDKEQKANALPAQIAKAVDNILKKASTAGWFCLAFVMLVGCGSTQQAAIVTDQAAVSFKMYDIQRDAFDEEMIEYYYTSESDRIERITKDAMDSLRTKQIVQVTKIVKEEVQGADGKPAFRERQVTEQVETFVIEQNAAEALTRQKLRLIAKTQTIVNSMRMKLANIKRNAANGQALLAGLKAYFDQSVDTLEAISTAQDGLIGFIGQFTNKTDKAAADKAASKAAE